MNQDLSVLRDEIKINVQCALAIYWLSVTPPFHEVIFVHVMSAVDALSKFKHEKQKTRCTASIIRQCRPRPDQKFKVYGYITLSEVGIPEPMSHIWLHTIILWLLKFCYCRRSSTHLWRVLCGPFLSLTSPYWLLWWWSVAPIPDYHSRSFSRKICGYVQKFS